MIQQFKQQAMKYLLTVAGLLFCLAPSAEAATIVTIDFDSLPSNNLPPLTSAPNFLASFGIPNVTFGGSGSGAAGPRVYNPAPHGAPSPSQLLIQHATSNDSGQTHFLDFHFDSGLVGFGLTRMGTTGGSSTNTWTAEFFNSSNASIGSFGESGLLVNAPHTPFSFTATGPETISRMRLTSIWTNATFRNIPVDDFVLTFNSAVVPEPSTFILFGLGIIGLGGYSWRRRSNH